MRFIFKNKDLSSLYYKQKDPRQYPPGVADSFFEVMTIIENAVNENDVRAFKSLHFEKLSGNRKDQYSLRLNKQLRLIIQIKKDKTGNVIWVIEIVDYH